MRIKLKITPADELERRGYYKNVKDLIEEMYEDNNRQSVTLVCASLGCPTSHYFLTRLSDRLGIDQAWKDKYIHAYVTVVGAWDGGVTGLEALISGPSAILDKIVIGQFVEESVALILQSMESMYTLIPKESIWGDAVLVETPHKSYTAKEYKSLFNDLGIPDSYEKFKAVLDMNPDFPAPNVPTVCIYGLGVDTPKRLVYEKDFNGKLPTGETPIMIMGDGDELVNAENAHICRSWESMKPRYNFRYKECKGVKHVEGCGQEMLLEIAQVIHNID